MSTPAYTVRIATAEDLPTILSLYRAWYDEGRMQDAGLRFQEADLEHFARKVLGQGLGVYFLAELPAGTPVGMFVGVSDFWLACHSQRILHEAYWWIHPDHRGTGLGDQMLAEAEAFARTHGYSYVMVLDWKPGAPRSLETYYQRHGYKPVQMQYWKEVR